MLFPVFAFAASAALSIVEAVDFTPVILGVLLVASVVVSVLIVFKGSRMILCFINNESSGSVSRELYAFEKYVRGDYIPRNEYNEIMSRNPSLSGGRQSRDYAKKMVKSGRW